MSDVDMMLALDLACYGFSVERTHGLAERRRIDPLSIFIDEYREVLIVKELPDQEQRHSNVEWIHKDEYERLFSSDRPIPVLVPAFRAVTPPRFAVKRLNYYVKQSMKGDPRWTA
jgi:hypothetical protein